MGGPTSVGSISRYLQDPISRPLCAYDRSISTRPLDSANVNYRALFLFIIDCYALVSRLFIQTVAFEISRRERIETENLIDTNFIQMILIFRYFFKFSNY